MSRQQLSSEQGLPSSDAGIRADVDGARGRASGRVTDLNLTGVAVQIGVAQPPAFVHGESVTLVLHFDTARSVQIEAIVHTHTEMDGFDQFEFAFVDPSAIRATLPAGLLRWFNERATFRVELKEAVPVRLENVDLGIDVSGSVRDISADGLGILIDTDAGTCLAPGLEVSAEFTLPRQDRALICQALICNRRTLQNETSAIGACFQWQRSSASASQRRDVTNYVMARQREYLKARVES